MPRKPPTAEEIAIKKQVEDFIKTIKTNAAPTVDVARAQSYFERAQKYQQMGLALLRGEEVEQEVEPGKNRVGRPKKEAPVTDGELFQADSAAAGEPNAAPATKTSKKKKDTPVGAENA